jgi:hypothetical protein
MSRILIGALSGWKYFDRRLRCLATWMADADEMDVESFFLLGCPTADQPEPIGRHALALPCPDDYASLPQRTLWFCRWALSQRSEVRNQRSDIRPPTSDLRLLDWDYLFKCDDDTYVSIPRLSAYDLAGRDYVGAEWRPGVDYGSGGAGYFLSRRAATIVQERLTTAAGAEDVEVGKVLRAAGIHLSIEPRLIPFGSVDRRPKTANDLITVHACADAFSAAHAETGLHATVEEVATTHGINPPRTTSRFCS